jgi:hypothetical protein
LIGHFGRNATLGYIKCPSFIVGVAILSPPKQNISMQRPYHTSHETPGTIQIRDRNPFIGAVLGK